MEFYNLKKILKYNATYNLIFGERSNGKTYAALKNAVYLFHKNKSQFAYIRRWLEDVTGRRASSLFDALNANNEISKITNGEFSYVTYYSGKFFLCNLIDGKPNLINDNILGHCFSLSTGEHDKSTSYPKIETVIFDEFLTNKTYLNDEFVLFMNILSTIIRRRENVKIFMLGNTVNRYSPYFSEMGLKHVIKMTQGSIDLYTYGNSKLKVAVEYCASIKNVSEESNKYFAFDNPKLNMIKTGAWELNLYPHLQCKFKPKEILNIFFIEFNNDVFQCEIVMKNNSPFIYIHKKTTEIKNEYDLVYSLNPSYKINYVSNIFKPRNKLQSLITNLFKSEKIFYQDNEIGDTIKNYLIQCKRI